MRAWLDNLKRKILVGVTYIVVSALLSVVSFASQGSAEPLRVGFSRHSNSALIYLADTQDFFKKRGVDVDLKEYEAGVLAVSDLIANKIDIATTSEFVFVLQSFNHPDLRMLASVCMASDQELVVRKDRGILRPQDLKGKRVAVPRGSSAEFFLYNYLIFNHIPTGSVRLVYRTPAEMIKAIADGTIDAALCWTPYTVDMAKRLGAKGTRWPAQNGQEYSLSLIAREGLPKKQPKRLEEFLAALSDAEGFITKYPDRAQTMVQNRLKGDAESFIDTWSRARHQLQLTQDLLVLMEREAKWAMHNKLVEKKEMPNYLDFLYFNALDKVKPEAVSIVH